MSILPHVNQAHQNQGTQPALIHPSAHTQIQTVAALLLSQQNNNGAIAGTRNPPNRNIRQLNPNGAPMPGQSSNPPVPPPAPLMNAQPAAQPVYQAIPQHQTIIVQPIPIIIQPAPMTINMYQPSPSPMNIIYQPSPSPMPMQMTPQPAMSQHIPAAVAPQQQPLAQRITPAPTPSQAEQSKKNWSKIALIVIAVVAAIALAAVAAAFLLNLVLLLTFVVAAGVCVTVGIGCAIGSAARAAGKVFQGAMGHLSKVTVPRIRSAVERAIPTDVSFQGRVSVGCSIGMRW